MKKLVNTSLLFAVLITAVSCKSSKKNSKTNVVDEVSQVAPATNPPVEVTYADPVQQKAHEEKPTVADNSKVEDVVAYVFSASFYSIGEGTDGEAIVKFKNYIDAFNKEEKVNLSYETNPWGREGEVDYCFKLEELSGNQRDKFISGAKKLFTEKNLVHIGENGQCHPKRR